ncbi:MAG: type II secretion system protein N [Saccharospirillum sp.]
MEWLNQLRPGWLILQKWLVTLLVMGSALYAAQFTWLWLEPVPNVQVPTLTPAGNNAGNTTRNDLARVGERLAQSELFGAFEAQPVAAVEEPRPVEAPDTRLNLTLQAILARGAEGEGFAIIAQRSGAGRAFSIGDDVFGQAELAAVYGDRVLLSRNGQMETLRYPRIESSGLLQGRDEDPRAPDPSTESTGNASFAESVQRAQEEFERGGNVEAQVEQMVSYIAERANSDPQGLIQEVGLEATGAGYQVTRNARQLQMAGLRPGDVVTAVNDNPVGNIAQDQMLLNQILQSGGELKISVQRGSRTFTIYQTLPGSR